MNAQQKTDQDEKIDLPGIARECWEKSDNDISKAQALMVSIVRNNTALFEALVRPMIEQACSTQIRRQIQYQKVKAWTPPNPTAVANVQPPAIPDTQPIAANGIQPRAIAALAASNSLLMFPIMGGTPLGEATGKDLDAAIEHYGKNIRTMTWRQKWMVRIREHVAYEQKVKAVFGDAELRNMQNGTEEKEI